MPDPSKPVAAGTPTNTPKATPGGDIPRPLNWGKTKVDANFHLDLWSSGWANTTGQSNPPPHPTGLRTMYADLAGSRYLVVGDPAQQPSTWKVIKEEPGAGARPRSPAQLPVAEADKLKATFKNLASPEKAGVHCERWRVSLPTAGGKMQPFDIVERGAKFYISRPDSERETLLTSTEHQALLKAVSPQMAEDNSRGTNMSSPASRLATALARKP
jgi:hypothetical protein